MAPEAICRAYRGGGAKGIALVGATSVIDMLDERYDPIAEVGTSAGSIVAAIKASKVSDERVQQVTDRFPFRALIPRLNRILDHIPLAGKVAEAIEIVTRGGFLNGDALLKDVNTALAHAGAAETFGDLADRRANPQPGMKPAAELYLVAHSIRHGMVIFPSAFADFYGITDPHLQSIALGTRCSSGIPEAFPPVPLRDVGGGDDFLSDGGINAVFPYQVAVDLMGRHHPGTRVVGFFLGPPGTPPVLDRNDEDFVIKYNLAYIGSVENQSNQVLNDPAVMDNTVMIYTTGVTTTEFDLTPDLQNYLKNQGVVGGLDWVVHDIVRPGHPPMTVSERAKLQTRYRQCRAEVDALIGAARAGHGNVRLEWLTPMSQRLDGVARSLGMSIPAAEVRPGAQL